MCSVLYGADVFHHVEHKYYGHRVRMVVAPVGRFRGRIAERPPTEAVRRIVDRLATLRVRLFDVVLRCPGTGFVHLAKNGDSINGERGLGFSCDFAWQIITCSVFFCWAQPRLTVSCSPFKSLSLKMRFIHMVDQGQSTS